MLQYCDFFTGMLSFWVTLVLISGIAELQHKSLLHTLGVLIVAFGVESDRSSFVPLIFGSLIPAVSYGYKSYQLGTFMNINIIVWPPTRRMLDVMAGLAMVGLGVVLFSAVETESNYQVFLRIYNYSFNKF